jgi:hypothetical protein
MVVTHFHLSDLEMKISAAKKQNNQILPARSRLWTPRKLPDLIAWNSVRTLQRLTADATTEFFYDVSGNVNALRQTAEAKQPTVKASSNFGNLKVLDFDGTNDFMVKSTPPDSLDIGDGDFFFCAAIAAATDTSNQTIMSLQRESADELRLFLTAAGVFTFRITGSEIASAAGDLEGSVNLVYAERINGSMKVYVNGTVGNVTDTSTSDITSDTATCLGSLNSTGAQFFDGQIAEVVYGGSTSKGIMDDERRQKLEGYMAHRCKIPKRLVSTHPYRFGPPRF